MCPEAVFAFDGFGEGYICGIDNEPCDDPDGLCDSARDYYDDDDYEEELE
jgi:hypothetical protein